MGFDLTEKIKVVNALEPDAYTAATAYSAPIDSDDYEQAMLIAAAGELGSSATLTTSVEESDATSRIVDDSGLAQDTSLVLRNGATDNTEIGIQFTTGAATYSVTQVDLMLKKVGTVTDGKKVTVTLQADSTDTPDDTDLITPIEVLVDDISTTAFEKVEFVFPSVVNLAAATKYWIVLEGDYDVSAANHITLSVDTVGSGGNIALHDADWGALVTTQKGAANVHAYSWSAITGATTGALADGTDDDKVFVGSLHLQQKKRYLRVKQVVGTNTSDCGAFLVLGGKKGGVVSQQQAAKFTMK